MITNTHGSDLWENIFYFQEGKKGGLDMEMFQKLLNNLLTRANSCVSQEWEPSSSTGSSPTTV